MFSSFFRSLHFVVTKENRNGIITSTKMKINWRWNIWVREVIYRCVPQVRARSIEWSLKLLSQGPFSGFDILYQIRDTRYALEWIERVGIWLTWRSSKRSRNDKKRDLSLFTNFFWGSSPPFSSVQEAPVVSGAGAFYRKVVFSDWSWVRGGFVGHIFEVTRQSSTRFVIRPRKIFRIWQRNWTLIPKITTNLSWRTLKIRPNPPTNRVHFGSISSGTVFGACWEGKKLFVFPLFVIVSDYGDADDQYTSDPLAYRENRASDSGSSFNAPVGSGPPPRDYPSRI